MARRRGQARVDWRRARAITGYAKPPGQVVERQFDGFDEELRRLARTRYEEIDFSNLWYYHHDLAYVDLQEDLFAYLFPVCLMDWQDTLLRNEPCSHGDSEFHYGLRRGDVLEKMLTEGQRTEVFEFFRDGFLDRIDQERGFQYAGSGTPAYGWIHRLNSLGLVMPDVSMVWNAWWAVETPGAAVAVIQYCSGLMYREGENPLFAAWTQDRGGGGPYLWENDSNIYDAGWSPENAAFVQGALDPSVLLDSLERAVKALEGQPEEARAREIVADFPNRMELVRKRAVELPSMLEAKDGPIEWPP